MIIFYYSDEKRLLCGTVFTVLKMLCIYWKDNTEVRLAQRLRDLFLPQDHNMASPSFLDATYGSGFTSLGLNVTA